MTPELETDFFAPPRPRIFAHRGDSGAFPENTLPAFRAAARLGAPYIELDVHMTRDGEIVVFHDPELERITGREGLLKELTLSQLQALDAGYHFARDGGHPFRGAGIRIPTLREVLSELRSEFFVIEVKQVTPSVTAATLDIIHSTGMSRRVLIASEHQEPLAEVRRLAPGVPTNFAAAEVAMFVAAMQTRDAHYAPPGNALQIPPAARGARLATPELVAAAHACGIEVHVWTINEPSQMRELLQMGVDGIMSDYPAELLKVAAAAPHPA